MDLQLKGKRALVTGGSRGIGKAIAKALAHEGVDVALLARNPQALADTARELSAGSGRKVIGVVANTGDDEQVRSPWQAPPRNSAGRSTFW
jgi:NAD(P)-dependent dehydrogenase (short-subunit alcohol dehydrogenase family)